MSVSDEQVIEQRLDLEMLERPHLWPTERRGMRCVFVRRAARGTAPLGERETGPCFRLADGSYMVMAHDWAGTSALTPTPCPYPSAEAVLADGWRVD